MMRSRVAGLAAAGGLAAVLAAGLATAPAGASTAGAAGGPAGTARPDAAKLLYNQIYDNNHEGVSSWRYPKSSYQEDTQAADDFVVPKGRTWTVTAVAVTGFYYNTIGGSKPAASLTVSFYQDTIEGKKHIPGTLIKSQTLKNTSSSGSFVISGITGVTLKAGRYWLSVQAGMTASTEDWWWSNSTADNYSPAVWRDPYARYGPACVTWTAYVKCPTDGGGAAGDLLFALYGGSGT